MLGANPWRVHSGDVRLAISPSGAQLAIVESNGFRVIDLSRGVVSYQRKAELGAPKQALFLQRERALLIISGDDLASVYPLSGGAPTSLGTVDFAEADRLGERVLLRNESSKLTCLIKPKDLRARRKIFWDCRSGYATFLPSGEVIRVRAGQLEQSNKALTLDQSVSTGKIWADPVEEKVYVLSPYKNDNDRHVLQEINLVTKKLTLREMPELFSLDVLREPTRHSLLLWLSLWDPVDGESASWLHFYDLPTGELRVLLDRSIPIQDALLSPAGEHLFVASQEGVTQYNIASQQAVNTQPKHKTAIQEVIFSDEDQMVVSRDLDRVIGWNLSTREPIFSIETNSSAMISIGTVLLIATRENDLFAVRLSDGAELWRRSMRAPIQSLMANAQGEVTVWRDAFANRAASVSPLSGQERDLQIPAEIEIKTRGFQRSWRNSSVEKVVWISSGEQISITDIEQTHTAQQKIQAKRFVWLLQDHLVAAITGQRIALLDANNAKVVGLTGPQTCQEELCKINVSPAARVAAVTDQSTTRLWDMSTQALLWEQRGATATAFSSDGAWIAVARENGELVVYPVQR